MLTAKLEIFSSTGSTFKSEEITLDAARWKEDNHFIATVKEFKSIAERLNHNAGTEDDDTTCHVNLEALRPEDEQICYYLSDAIDDIK